MNLTKIKEAFETYHAAEQKAISLRLEWPKAKSIIVDTLKHIKKELGMKAKVKIEDKMEGMEIVYLSFGKTGSGIFKKVGNTKSPLIKEGGHLFFTQIYNGKITIWKTLPTIKKLMSAQQPVQLGMYKPQEITAEIIIDHATDFVQSLAEWEDQELNSKGIGYKI